MRRFTLLFATLLSLLGVTQVKADEITVYDGTGTNNYLPLYGYYADTKGGISEFIIPSSQLTALSGKTIEQIVFYLSSPAESSFGSASFNVYLEEVVGSNYDDSSASQLTDSKTLVYTGALDATGATMDIPFTNNYTYNGGNLLIAIEVGTKGSYKTATFYGTTISNNAGRYKYGSSSGRVKFIPKTTFITPTVGAALTVKDGSQKLTSPYAYNFGLATAGTSKTFTLANPGTEDLTISVSKTGDFNATLSATTITAGGEVTLTVTMPETTGSSAVTITPDATSGIDPFVINVSGTIRDANKVYEYGFTALPTDWTTTGTWYYSEANGAYNTSWYLSSNARLITPQLTISEGEVFFVEAKGYSTSNTSYQHLQMQYSADGSTWTNFDSEPTLDPSNWQTFSFTGVPAGKYYIAINASQADIRMFYGGELPNEPKMVVTQPASLDFGVITAATAKTFTIANTGRATLEGINVTSSNAAFTITGAPTSLEAGASAEVTITMAATTTGALSSDITVSATGMDNVAFTVTGIVLPEGMMVVDFNDNKLPAGWGNEASNKWSFSEGKAYCTSAAELTTPKLQFAEGDMLAIKITSYDDYDNNYLEITGSVDGTSWDAFTTKRYISRSQIPYGSYATLVIADIPATVKYLKFKGYYVRIDEIAGLTYDQDAPVMAFTAADFAAGKVTESKSKTYSVSNSGTGTLTVNIASDNEKFTVEPAQLVITDEAKEFTVTFNYEEGVYGKFNANITVTPTYDESAAVTFAASAQVVDPNVWAEDFEDGTLPIGWVANNWTIGTFTSYENTTTMALAPSGSTAGTLITPCLTAKEGDVLTWDAYFKWADESLIVEYLTDEQKTWNAITTIYGTESGEQGSGQVNYHKEMSFTAPADGNYYLRFTSTYQNGVDNFNGFKLNLPDHIMAITASNIPTSGSYSPSMKATQSFNATVTVKESRGVDEENVVAKLYMGDEVIGTSDATTVEAGKTKVITITATPTVAATEGAEMHIEVEWAGTTLTTEAVTRYVAEFVTLALTETEEKEITTGYSAVYDQVTLTRNFAEGWNTFVAPLSVSLSEFGEGVKAYTFTGYSDGTLNFSSVSGTSLNPATPYVIYIPEAIDNKVFVWNSPVIYSSYVGEENIKTTKDGATFQGTYAPIAAPNMEGKWGVTDEGRIAQGSAAASIDGFRAYFELPATTSAPMLSIDGGPATPIDALRLNGMENGVYYDLNGRRVAQPSKGLYIINGKKVVIK